MSIASSLFMRGVFRRIHRWIGVGLLVLLIPIGLSGSLLVWHDDIETMLYPARYAVSGPGPLLSPDRYLAAAGAVLDDGLRPSAVRFPAKSGAPVIVMARAAPLGGQLRLQSVYLDPPTARVLDVVNPRASFFGWLHRFHENLTIPQFSGRQVVGWAGVGMLAMTLSGLLLWWPRNGAARAGLRWRRSPTATSNLHHLVGVWVAVPLALASMSGIYLAFPQTARITMAALAPMSNGPRPGFGQPFHDATMTPDRALAAALDTTPGATARVLFMPAVATDRGAAGRNGPAIWRVELRRPSGDVANVTVDDRSGETRQLPDPLAGDVAAQWIRSIHDGSRGGLIWPAVVFLVGLCPAILGFTGVIVWLRGRRARRGVAGRPVGEATGLSAAE